MLPDFSNEHDIFRGAVRNYVEREVKPHVLDWEQAGQVPRSLFRNLGELGFLGVRLSSEYGGSGLDFWYTTILIQEFMRAGSIGVPVAIMAHAEFATQLIAVAGSDEARAELLPAATAGKKIGALGVSEPNAGSDVAAIRTRAVRDGDDFIINGSKTFITNGTIADFITTAVRTGGSGSGGISLIVVPAETAGLTRKRLKKIGTHASDTAELSFEDCRVPAHYLLGEENGGFRLIMQGFTGERLVLAVMATMQMRMMWEAAREHGHDRKVFGKPLLGFQVWQHRLADVVTKIEAAETLAYRAIDLYVRGEPCEQLVSMAKLFATESALDVARECAQIFGGMSHMEECIMGRLYRDSLALTIGAGSSEIMREIIARSAGLTAETASR
jgi:citronellyl-CoA dehydrogenase